MAERLLEWDFDARTLFWAIRCPFSLPADPAKQFAGSPLAHPLYASTWRCRLLRTAFPEFVLHGNNGALVCTPDNIIRCLSSGLVLEALVLTIGWGSMTRTLDHVYTEDLKVMERVLRRATASIDRAGSVAPAWANLRRNLSWTATMASKFLHFAGRSLGFRVNPPVPMDNEVILQRAWPRFKHAAALEQEEHDLLNVPLPRPWGDATQTWAGYSRYVTAVSCWAAGRGWTTTELENTLYEVYKDG
ncbi:MAG: hypothetical protein LAO51_16015 [Acidobacteriia bacterium]|nr:hypothetical protein [Terriglobia bacterium]